MPTEGKPDYLALRILDNNTGAEIVHELAHQHDCKWEVRALQQGMPGSSTLGTFTIHSPGGPQSDEFRKAWQTQWTQIAIGQRVEGYLGNVVTGSPRFSGVITGMKRPLNASWEITGVDSLWMLQQSQVLPGETIFLSGNSAWFSAAAFYGTQEVVWDDDFSGWSGSTHPNSSDYTNGGFSASPADPLFGLPNLSTAATSAAVTTATWGATAQFIAGVVSAHGVVVANAGASTNAIGPGIVLLSDGTVQNALMVDALLIQTAPNSALYNVSLRIGSWAAGVFTQQTLVNNVFTNVAPTFPFELVAVMGYAPSGPSGGQSIFLKALLNGKDPNCVWTGFAPPASGGVGIRHGAPAVGTSYFNRLQFHARTSGNPSFLGFGTNRFQTGVHFNGNGAGQNATGNGQTHLDMIQAAMTFDGAGLRKNPGAGHKADALNYAVSPGTDYSSSVVLEEGVNIDANGTQVATVPEMLSTDVKLNALPGGDSGGSIVWGRVGNSGDAVLTDTAADMGLPGFGLLVRYARQVQGRKVNPLQAQQVRVVRDAAWLSVGNGAGPRELDSVQIYIPTLNVQRQSAVIQGYDFVEGEATMLVYLSQLPASAVPNHALQRIVRPVEYIGTTYATR